MSSYKSINPVGKEGEAQKVENLQAAIETLLK